MKNIEILERVLPDYEDHGISDLAYVAGKIPERYEIIEDRDEKVQEGDLYYDTGLLQNFTAVAQIGEPVGNYTVIIRPTTPNPIKIYREDDYVLRVKVLADRSDEDCERYELKRLEILEDSDLVNFDLMPEIFTASKTRRVMSPGLWTLEDE